MNYSRFLCLATLTFGLFAGALQAQGYSEVSVANGGVVVGRVFFGADYPEAETLQPDRDADTCGVRIPVEQFVVDADTKGLANAVIRIEGVSKGKPFEDAKPRIEQLKCRYDPHVLVVQPGQEFEIVNQDPVLHNVHAYNGDDTAFNLAQPFQGQATSQILNETGTVRVACDVHSWMQAWVLVIDSPYFAVTDAQGNFSIPDVPPGSYQITMWHELLGIAEKTVTVTTDGSSDVQFVITG